MENRAALGRAWWQCYGSTGATVSGKPPVSATTRLIGPAAGLYDLTVSSATATSGISEREGTVHPHMFSAVVP
jgi:hypothetical protein